MSRAFGIVNFAGNNIQGNPMQAYRPTGAISFLGRYRVVDFPISNMSNSGIDSIQVYIRRKPRSLVEHLGTGRHYNINSKRGNLNLLFCENGDENSIYSTDLFHVPHQFQLCSRTIQIVGRIINLKVCIPGEIICQESHTTLISHYLRPDRQTLNLHIRQRTAASFYETFCIDIIQFHITGNFGKILFILRTCTLSLIHI